MEKSKMLKLVTSTLACFAVVSIGNHCYNIQAVNKIESDIQNSIQNVETEEPIIFTEVSSYDTKYDFSDNSVLAEHSDLIVIGKVTNLDKATNYNPTTKNYGKARTPGNLEVLQVLKSDGKVISNNIEFLDMGGMMEYKEYVKSLLPAQKAKREYLMSQNGIDVNTRSNIFVKQSVENQLEIEENKTYIMYLKYDSTFGKYMVVNQPYGVKEYEQNTGKILNHVTETIENIDEMM